MKKINSIYLFLTGMFLAFDFTGLLGGSLLSRHKAPLLKSDSENLTADWIRVGDTFHHVMQAEK